MQTNVTNFFKKRSSADTSDDITGCSGKRQATESQIYATLDSDDCEENIWLDDSASDTELSDTNASDIETLAGPTSISLSVMPGADRIIERCTRKPPGPGDISSGKAEGPTQSLRIIFPSKCFGTKQRAFRQAWYDSHKWLEYSISQDSAYCFCCRKHPISPLLLPVIISGRKQLRKMPGSVNMSVVTITRQLSVCGKSLNNARYLEKPLMHPLHPFMEKR